MQDPVGGEKSGAKCPVGEYSGGEFSGGEFSEGEILLPEELMRSQSAMTYKYPCLQKIKKSKYICVS